MWYRIVKSSFGVGPQRQINLEETIQPQIEEVINKPDTALYKTVEESLSEIRSTDAKQNMGTYEKSQGSVALMNGEGMYPLNSSLNNLNDLPSDKSLY
jgi:hypothetical protein